MGESGSRGIVPSVLNWIVSLNSLETRGNVRTLDAGGVVLPSSNTVLSSQTERVERGRCQFSEHKLLLRASVHFDELSAFALLQRRG